MDTFKKLRDLKKLLPKQEIKLKLEKTTDIIKLNVGDIFPLPVNKYNTGRWEKITPNFTKTDRGGAIILATLNHNYYYNGPVAIRDNKCGGLVCFLNQDLPEDTIAFQVVSRKQNCAVVIPITGTDKDLFDVLEAEAKSNNSEETVSELVTS